MPAVQREPRNERCEPENRDARAGEEYQGSEHARDIQPILRFEQTESEARAFARGTRGEFRDHGRNQGEAATNAPGRASVTRPAAAISVSRIPPR